MLFFYQEVFMSFKNQETQCVHSGEHKKIEDSVCTPIFQSAIFLTHGEENYHDIKYIRLNNTPLHLALHQKIASLEKTAAALVTASGMAAISNVLFTLLGAKDHLLAQNCLYGGTHDFLSQDAPKLGLESSFIDLNSAASWEQQLQPNTKAIYVETLTNPLLEMGDLEAVVKFAKAHNLTSIIDNTFATPINFNPIEWGFDIVIHSCTKYLNGHSDIVAGCVAGSEQMIKKITYKSNHLGGCLDPHACYLLLRGMKTLAIRVKQQNQNALELARFLEKHPAIATVNYPGLKSHPQYERAKKLLRGFGGMLSFELKAGVKAAKELLHQVEIPLVAPSLGGVESLITRPATTSHGGMSPQDRAKVGITDSLVRISVGIESCEELKADLEQALAKIN